MAGKRMLRIVGELSDPFAQHVLVEIQIARRLRNRNTPILHKSYGLKLELAAEFPSLNSNSPVPLNTLSRSPRNRQQAKMMVTSRT